ncbi:rhamnogalacturonan acetylesterase [Haloferula sargassicola]|uniref:SGNH hydrolase-type esterase domain-containing protein n=1 Tax=Haloferula sargassicola TaxID=490096 RepID=A0ABP9UPJ4_9BACT
MIARLLPHAGRGWLYATALFALMSLASAQGIARPKLKIDDIPRETQAGEGPGRYVPPVPARKNLPTLWLIGDSTVRNGSKGDNGPEGQWGWGAPITAYFDLKKINVVNRALGGTSSRSFYHDRWEDVRKRIKEGDIVMMQFGANDHGGAKGKGALDGVGNETEMNGDEEVHSFGWYLRRYVEDTRTQGGKPVVCSLTPRKSWAADGRFRRGGGHAEWAWQAAKETNAAFVPLNEIIARRYEKLRERKVDALYVPSPAETLHTGWDGAVVNAECVIAGLKALDEDPLADFYSKRAGAIRAWKQR